MPHLFLNWEICLTTIELERKITCPSACMQSSSYKYPFVDLVHGDVIHSCPNTIYVKTEMIKSIAASGGPPWKAASVWSEHCKDCYQIKTNSASASLDICLES